MKDFSRCEAAIGVTFTDRRFLVTAFTHRSYLNENRSAGEHNERLEFLGDAVLELAVTDYLYRNYPKQNEGEMTSYRAALVNYQTLGKIAADLGMNEFLLLSYGESKDTGRARQVILANTFEALIGAIYLDQGFSAAAAFIEKHLYPLVPAIIKNGKWTDSKSLFQERAQEKVGVTPSYETVKEVGPDHDKQFTIAVKLGGDYVAEGVGKSKQEAEQAAAQAGLKKKGWG